MLRVNDITRYIIMKKIIKYKQTTLINKIKSRLILILAIEK